MKYIILWRFLLVERQPRTQEKNKREEKGAREKPTKGCCVSTGLFWRKKGKTYWEINAEKKSIC